MGRNDHALNAIEKAAVLKFDSPEVWNNRGEILVLLNQFDEARSSFDRALEIDAECAAAWFGRGQLSCFQVRRVSCPSALRRPEHDSTVDKPHIRLRQGFGGHITHHASRIPHHASRITHHI
jgi:tetratricopeptide (TPR) repeat protein